MEKFLEKAIADHAKAFGRDRVVWSCEEAVSHTRELVTRLALNHKGIGALLEAMFERVKELSHAQGRSSGAEEERNTNPAMKSVGEAVSVAIKHHTTAMRETVAAVFNAECNRSMNPHYAFNQAIKALE